MKLLAYTNEKLEDLYKTGVYQITNKISGKVYVGHAARVYPNKPASCGFYKRWSEHIYDLTNNQHPNIHLQRAWVKYGDDAFIFSILEFVDPDKCEEREQFYLDNLSREERYNISPVAGSSLGREVTAETRAKLSAAGLGKRTIPFTLVSPEGVIINDSNLSKFAKENNLSQGALVNITKGKTFHYKGYTSCLEHHKVYKEAVVSRGITVEGCRYCVRWKENKETKVNYFGSFDLAVIKRDELESSGYTFRICVKHWKKKVNPELDENDLSNTCSFSIIDPDGNTHSGLNFRFFCKERKLGYLIMLRVIKGEALHYKGWTANLKSYNIYKMAVQERGISYCNTTNKWFVCWVENKKNERKSFIDKQDAIAFRDSLNYKFKITVFNWQEKVGAQKDS